MIRFGLLIPVLMVLFTVDGFSTHMVASIKQKNGEVSVLRQKRVLPAHAGLILKDQDTVVTAQTGKVTIIFRDNSEIRLFHNTRFKIEKTQETKGEKRSFLNRFRLQLGSFWGKFTRGSQRTTIQTPTAVCGIKGTDVSFSTTEKELDVTLSSGLVDIQNETEQLLLTPGKKISAIQKTGFLKDKVQDIPYRLQVKAETALEVPESGSRTLTLSVQLLNTKTGDNIHRSGRVYFSSNIDKVKFPAIVLNQRGFANFQAAVTPFQEADFKKGKLDIYAIMDGEEAMEIGSGFMTLPFKLPRKRIRTIRIDAAEGNLN